MTVTTNAGYIKRQREVRTTEPEWRSAQSVWLRYDPQNSRLLVAVTQRSRIQVYNKQPYCMAPQLNF